MSKVAVIYWSGTGNTESMAEAVVLGAKEAKAEVEMFSVADFDTNSIDNYDAIALGCPSMGSEELEEEEFRPMFESIQGQLENKKVALFGSYGWGDGEWMRNWESECSDNGINLVTECVICNEAPEDDDVENCKNLGACLVN